LGRWFVWDSTDPAPVQLVAGGSGVVPLMSMLRTHAAAGHPARMHLLYSVAAPEASLYRSELGAFAQRGALTYLYTRRPPPLERRPPGRVTRGDLTTHAVPPAEQPACFVCGPTSFVEVVLEHLVAIGHDPARLRAERYGERGTG
jgi:ferredoxin-NADP reductase